MFIVSIASGQGRGGDTRTKGGGLVETAGMFQIQKEVAGNCKQRHAIRDDLSAFYIVILQLKGLGQVANPTVPRVRKVRKTWSTGVLSANHQVKSFKDA